MGKYIAYQNAEWSGASKADLADMRDKIISEIMTEKGLAKTAATFRFWRELAEVRDNEM